MKISKVCVLGGSSFVGRHVVERLANRGRTVRVLTRNRERSRHLLVLPTVELIEADVHDAETLKRLFEGQEAVVNLVGILNEKARAGESFRDAHVELPRKVVNACRETGVRRLLHMSALNADAHRGPSQYLYTKGEGEDLLHQEAAGNLAVTSFRPSVIFGPEDSFFNRFGSLLKLSPFVFPLACPMSRFAPVYVGDVALAFATALENKKTYENRYDLCGPNIYTLKELVEYTARTLGLRRKVIGLNQFLSRLQAQVLGLMPGKPFSIDNYLSLQVDSVCKENSLGLEQLHITATAIDAVVPMYLAHRSVRGHYKEYRRSARHG
jgi:Predicted nucleoside-diphosphate-sugar epimerases